MLRFWHQLSLELGIPVGELQQRMSHIEFVYWQAFYSREPLRGARNDLNTAMLMSLIANVNKKKGVRAIRPDRFIPDYWGERARNLGQRISNTLRAMGANDKRA